MEIEEADFVSDDELSAFQEEDEGDNVDGPSSHGALSESNHEDTKTKPKDDMEEIHHLAKKETRRVRIWKAILWILILVAAALVTAGTYRILRGEENDDFELSYTLFAESARDALMDHYDDLRLAMSSCSIAITGSAITSNQTFPNVVLNDFETLGQATRYKSGLEVINWGPNVQKGAQRLEWEAFARAHAQQWIDFSRATIEARNSSLYKPQNYENRTPSATITTLPWQDASTGFHSPVFQMSPPPFSNIMLNIDVLAFKPNQFLNDAMTALNSGVFGPVDNFRQTLGTVYELEEHEAFHNSLVDWDRQVGDATAMTNPHSVLMEPIYEAVNNPSSNIVGSIRAVVSWDFYMTNLLPKGVRDIMVVLRNTCNQSFSYNLIGNSAYYMGSGDFHNSEYDNMEYIAKFYNKMDNDFDMDAMNVYEGYVCLYTVHIYPTKALEDEYSTSLPLILTMLVSATFIFIMFAFVMYDWFVHSRNAKFVRFAATSNAIVSSMFPAKIRDELMEQHGKDGKGDDFHGTDPLISDDSSSHNRSFSLRGEQRRSTIADFYPEVTIMFSDIVGFTAWSSVREPAHVFELLEAVYSEFDRIAKKRRVFKVETVGDSYVAATGLPDPRKDHAVAMCRFARDCNYAMKNTVAKLEVRLGPETGDLAMRFGIHSGPVTAGVLRGERARFQLFGDTMNTASRMESRGEPNRIQVSQDTAELLRAAGKGSWLTARDEMIDVKGKGMMVTYFLSGGNVASPIGPGSFTHDNTTNDSSISTVNGPTFEVAPSSNGDSSEDNDIPLHELDNKIQRLVTWNVGLLLDILRKIHLRSVEDTPPSMNSPPEEQPHPQTILAEVKEVIALPHWLNTPNGNPKQVELPQVAIDQLADLVGSLAMLYKENPFHNFEHASHVTLAVSKLLSRVVDPKIEGVDAINEEATDSLRHEFSYGITSDPLVHFALVFSAIIHDIDHPGVPNTVLLKEGSGLSKRYKRSIAEQNSFQLAWDMLMESRYEELRNAICRTESDLQRFRQLLVNATMATDVMDKDLNVLRRARWEKAFAANSKESHKDRMDRMATIVIEHLIQAADVAHTMQHWHVYLKWNKRLFSEQYDAFLAARVDKDPSEGWYESELGFFDYYIIPLAKKLKDCGVFGVSSDEYLSYAEKNRQEWKDRGREVLAGYVESVKNEQKHEGLRAN